MHTLGGIVSVCVIISCTAYLYGQGAACRIERGARSGARRIADYFENSLLSSAWPAFTVYAITEGRVSRNAA